MKKQSLKSLIASYHRAQRKARQTALRRQRRLVEIRLAARRRRAQLDIVLGAESRRWRRGEISLGSLSAKIEVVEKELAEIDQMLASVGIEKAESKHVDTAQGEPKSGAGPTKPKLPIVTVEFWSAPCNQLREVLRPQCGLRYQPDESVWRGRADRALVEKIIEQHGEWHRVRIIQ